MKIPKEFLEKFDEESEAIGWGEIIIKAVIQNRKPVFFLDKHTSEKYTSDSISAIDDKN